MFNRHRGNLLLENVTLLTVCATNTSAAAAALMKSKERISFGAVKLLSHEKPKGLNQDIEFTEIRRLRLRDTGIDDYSYFMIYDLWKYVSTDFCLVIQGDGYVVNPKSWQNDFFEYDYIGAPWPIRDNSYIDPFGNPQQVGNGGFSFRSKKLLTVPQNNEVVWDVNASSFYKNFGSGSLNEDGNICVHNKHIYEKAGCKFAPVDVAVHFSQELPVPEAHGVKPFGFHRYLPK
jgi:hypothetical protein